MSQDLSRFPPNSRLGNTDNSYVGHMCYCPMHLNISTPKESVADWVGTGRSLRPGDYVSLVTFQDGTSTIMCVHGGVNSVRTSVGDREPEKGDWIVWQVPRERMETAGIYEDHRNTFKEAVSVQTGGLEPDGKLYPTIDNLVFKVVRDALTDEACLERVYQEYDDRHPIDKSREGDSSGNDRPL